VQEEYHRWYSPSVGHDMELLAYGHGGAPVIVFPTSFATFTEWKDFLMIDSLRDKIDQGFIQIYCPDSEGRYGWYNKNIHPHDRVMRHNAWEHYIGNELLPFIRHRNSNHFIILAGTSFGAYLAVNYALKFPQHVNKVVALSGSYSVTNLTNGYYDQEVYFNCPTDYVPNLSDQWYLDRYRQIEWNIVTSDHDIGVCKESTNKLVGQFKEKGIPVHGDYWNDHTGHDWPYWRNMIRKYL
jgi:esterase/lipase superfamily enzyme